MANTGPLLWGERSSALPKQLTYVLSLDLVYEVVATEATDLWTSLVLRIDAPQGAADPESSGFTYHVRDETLVRTPNGTVREVPHGAVRCADDRLVVDRSGKGSLSGRVVLELDAEGRVSAEYTGVVAMTRNVGRALDERRGNQPTGPLGSAFSTFRSTTERAKYRWLMENQLFAFGRVEATEKPKRLRFSYDVYLAG